MKIFVPKNKIKAMSNPEFFISKLTTIRRACCVYMKLIERPVLSLMICARGAAPWQPSKANAKSDSFIKTTSISRPLIWTRVTGRCSCNIKCQSVSLSG